MSKKTEMVEITVYDATQKIYDDLRKMKGVSDVKKVRRKPSDFYQAAARLEARIMLEQAGITGNLMFIGLNRNA